MANDAIGASALRGHTVIATRPRSQGHHLHSRLRECGAQVIEFPTLQIELAHDDASVARARAAIGDAQIVIFISRNAVDGLVSMLGMPATLAGREIAAVGQSTRERLERYGVAVSTSPQLNAGHLEFSTEALLAHPALAASQLVGKRIAIVRGDAGRDALGIALGERGAQVVYVPVYKRAVPAIDAQLCQQVLDVIDPLVVVTSVAGAKNFWAMLATHTGRPALHWLRMCRYVVISQRIAEQVTALGGCRTHWLALRASDEAVVAAILEGVTGHMSG
ncbi:MAG: uroporphyrinogen-III synthase [Gammaproteobacteria bacterium]|jgi:uroporphyrinogen-III synthase